MLVLKKDIVVWPKLICLVGIDFIVNGVAVNILWWLLESSNQLCGLLLKHYCIILLLLLIIYLFNPLAINNQ